MIKRLILTAMLLALTTWSSSAIVRITTAKGPQKPCRLTENNENVQTYHSGGAGSLPGGADPDYDSLADWEDDTDYDLVSANITEVLEVYSGVHDDSIVFSGATSNQDCHRTMRAAPGHKHIGIPGTGAQIISSSVQTTISIEEQYVQLQDLDITNTWGDPLQYPCGVMVLSNADGFLMVGCIVHDVIQSGDGFHGQCIVEGINVHNTKTYYVNNIVCNCEDRGINIGNSYMDTDTYIYNCTIYGCMYGVRMEYNGNIHAVNVLSAENATMRDWYISIWGSGTIQKTTSTAEGVDTTGWFRDPSSWNLHLHHPDSAGNGTSLSNDPNFPFDDDIDGLWRRDQWSIGADQRN